jgi:predicted ferric reductase
MHPLALLALYLAVVLAPLALAWAQGKPPRPFRDELATALGLQAYAILMVEFVLSGRFRTISARIGMDVTMRFHQLLARSALVMVVLHPLLYATPMGTPPPWDTTGLRVLAFHGWPAAAAVAAFVLLPALVLTAIFRDQLGWKYETWRLLHGIGALLVAAFAAGHALAGRYGAHPVLAAYCLALFAIAVASLAWVYAAKPLQQRRRPYAVAAVRRVADRTWELAIRPQGHEGLRFAAGQFVWLNVGHSPFSLHENPYSISSAPQSRAEIQFLIKEAGDFSGSVGSIRPGTRAYLDGPHGNLTLERRQGRGIALVAGGVGVAPLLAILRGLVAAGDPRPVVLVYANRVAGQIAYRDELDALARRGHVRVHYVLSEPPEGWTGAVGQLDAALVRTLFSFPDAPHWLYLVCGPVPAMEKVERALLDLGVPASQIVAERFRYD